MSSDAPEYAYLDVSVLLYRAILSVWTWVMACETEWRAVDSGGCGVGMCLMYGCKLFPASCITLFL